VFNYLLRFLTSVFPCVYIALPQFVQFLSVFMQPHDFPVIFFVEDYLRFCLKIKVLQLEPFLEYVLTCHEYTFLILITKASYHSFRVTSCCMIFQNYHNSNVQAINYFFF